MVRLAEIKILLAIFNWSNEVVIAKATINSVAMLRSVGVSCIIDLITFLLQLMCLDSFGKFAGISVVIVFGHDSQ